MRALVLNAGSSSLKWTVLGAGAARLDGADEPWSAPDGASRAEQLGAALRRAPAFDAVGHRIVHGGTRFHQAVLIDTAVRAALEQLAELDPEHMTPALAGIDAVYHAFPALPQVAAFDTAFHATLSEAASGYALPFEWTERWGLRRFGFHGLSVAYAVERTRELLGELPRRLIVCHLGSGCSLTAVEKGRSVDTTMGFSPLEGLMMATRSGSVDPGLLLHLEEQCGLSARQLREALTHRSGLLGVSGISNDLRKVLAAAEDGSARARLAYERFVLSARHALGAMTAALGGVDAVVFTGGIGENSGAVRRDVSRALAFAGLELASKPEGAEGDRVVSEGGSDIAVLVVKAREDLAILGEMRRVLG